MSETTVQPVGGESRLAREPVNPGLSLDGGLARLLERRQARAQAAMSGAAPSPLAAAPAPGMGHNQPPEEMQREPDPLAGLPEYIPGQHMAEPVDPNLPDGQPNAAYTVTIDGRAERVAAAELIRGYQREKDYTQKTQALAARAREVEGMAKSFTDARDQMLAQLASGIAAGNEEFAGKEMNWQEEYRKDAYGYPEKKARYDDWVAKVDREAKLRHQQSYEQEQETLRLLRAGHNFLVKALPGWANDASRVALQGALTRHAMDLGWSAEELERQPPRDPRQIIMAYESMMYRRLVQQKIAPVAPGPARHPQGGAQGRPLRTPNGAAIPATVEAAEQRLAQSHSIHDALNVLHARRGFTPGVDGPRRRAPALDIRAR